MPPVTYADTTESFAMFVSGLRRRDDSAWQELNRRYTRRLIGLARLRLDERLTAKLDPEDVVQSVYRMLDQRLQHAGLQPQTWDHLWGMLALLTGYRCHKWFRHFFATQKRELESPLPGEGEDTSAEPTILAAYREPTPEEALELAEEVHRLLPHLDSQTARIFVLGLLGHEDHEISKDQGVTEVRVRFAREDCACRLQRALRGEGRSG